MRRAAASRIVIVEKQRERQGPGGVRILQGALSVSWKGSLFRRLGLSFTLR